MRGAPAAAAAAVVVSVEVAEQLRRHARVEVPRGPPGGPPGGLTAVLKWVVVVSGASAESSSMALWLAWPDCNAAGASVAVVEAAAAVVAAVVAPCEPGTRVIGHSSRRVCYVETPRGCRKPPTVGSRARKTSGLIREACRAASVEPAACQAAICTAVHVATSVVDAGVRGGARTEVVV